MKKHECEYVTKFGVSECQICGAEEFKTTIAYELKDSNKSETIENFKAIVRLDSDFNRAFKDYMSKAFIDEVEYFRVHNKHNGYINKHRMRMIAKEAAEKFLDNFTREKK